VWVLLASTSCAPGGATQVAGAAAPSDKRAAGSADASTACPIVPVGLGCHVFPFQGTCSSHLSLNDAELEALQQSRYLNFRFGGDRRPFEGRPPVTPSAAHEAFVASGISIHAVVTLVELLGGPRSPNGIDWPEASVCTAEGFSPDHAGVAWKLTPETQRLLAGVQDLTTLSERWDRKARELAPGVPYGPNALNECRELLSGIVEVARDAESTGRRVYVFDALARFEPKCAELGGCGGLGCDSDGGPSEQQRCHTHRDECLQSADCGAARMCAFDAAEERFTCRARP
jgi:hypothetical protein